jgi:hypothetical protein
MKPTRKITRLINSIRHNNEKTVKEVLSDYTLNVNETDEKGDTPLYVAIYCNRENFARLLLNHRKIDVNIRGTHGDTALYNAVVWGRTSIIEMLLNHPNIEVNKGTMTPLYLASHKNREDALKLLLAHPDININGSVNFSPIKELVCFAQTHLIEIFLSSRKDVDTNSLVQLAHEYHFTEIANLILEYEKDIVGTRNRLRREMGMDKEDFANLLVLMLLICDGHMTLATTEDTKSSRFFKIASVLPLELQMILCNRMYYIKGQFVQSKHIKFALEKIVGKKINTQ